MDFLKDSWPFIIIAAWFGFKWLRIQRLKSKLPELKRLGAKLIDVRSSSEFQLAHADGSINIPLNELNHRINEIPKNVPIILACASGTRSGMAKLLLRKHGLKDVYNVGNWTNFN